MFRKSFKRHSTDNMKETGLYGYIYDFSVDYKAIAVDDILGIHKCLVKKNNIRLNVWIYIENTFYSYYISCNVLNVNPLKCVSMNNQLCKIRTKIININNNDPTFYPFSISVNKCSGGCNNINDPYAKLCVPDVVKNINVRVFNLMSRSNETRHIEWHETCKSKCRLDSSGFNNKQKRSKDKCRCECKELIDKGICDKGFIWHPSNCDCECNKL